MKAFRYFVAVLLFATGSAGAADPITVLGLPLGGKLKMPLKQCPSSLDVRNYRNLCWVGEPTIVSGGTRMGGLGVPSPDQRPKWAAYGSFDAQVAKDGTLESLDVRTFRADEFVEILNSITGRFGQSQHESRPGSAIMAATWDRKDIHIELLCSGSFGCKTTFTSAAEHADRLRELAARKAKDAARPASP
jgi:hypothetical protein